ncbi:MAG: hypothetical protein AB7O67_13155 [Vicinamibacterales bacterium]
MSDPLRSDDRPADALAGVDRDARIEHLLLAGLEHYFAGEFEPAIHLWTRVLFLDRQHDRARAYIERARSAQAEEQRESEALVHQGLEAFDAGDVPRARALLRDAVERGGAVDEALGVLGRIDRLDRADRPAPPPAPPRRQASAPPALEARVAAPRPPAARPGARWALLVVVALGCAAVFVWGLPLLPSRLNPAGRPASPVALSGAPLAVPAPGVVPVPPAMEHYLSRARVAFNAGRLRDALRQLDHVPVGDPSRPEADRLRARIQRELLAVAAAEAAFTPAAEPPSTEPPPE